MARAGKFGVRIFGITKPGLICLAASVLALWGCLAAERAEMRRAETDLRASLRTLNRLRERTFPVDQQASPFAIQRPSSS